jgi:TRAP-type C4-dicarboxylate transport system substrate-binding protein
MDTLREEAEYSDRRGWTLSLKRLNTLTKEYRDTLTEEAEHSNRSGWTLSPKREAEHSDRRI